MTARTRNGYHGHSTHGADHGKQHERLTHAHTSGSRPEGAPMGGQAQAVGTPDLPAPAEEGGGALMAPEGQNPPSSPSPEANQDTEEGDQS